MESLGHQIKDKVKELRNSGILFINNGDTDNDIFEIKGVNFRLKVVTNSNWLGLEFELLDENDQVLLSHAIDTDLYNLSDPENLSFAQETEDEIVQFLDSFANGEIMVGEIEGEKAVVIPGDNMFIRIKSGKRMSKTEHFENKEQALAEGKFKPLK